MTNRNEVETRHLNLTLPEPWFKELERVSGLYGLSKQELIRNQIGEFLKLLPKKEP